MALRKLTAISFERHGTWPSDPAEREPWPDAATALAILNGERPGEYLLFSTAWNAGANLGFNAADFVGATSVELRVTFEPVYHNNDGTPHVGEEHYNHGVATQFRLDLHDEPQFAGQIRGVTPWHHGPWTYTWTPTEAPSWLMGASLPEILAALAAGDSVTLGLEHWDWEPSITSHPNENLPWESMLFTAEVWVEIADALYPSIAGDPGPSRRRFT